MILAEVAAKLDEIEAEMRRIGWWDVPEPPPEAFESRRAFLSDTMAFATWLRFVLLPRARSIVEARGELPPSSMVGTQAIREFDGDDRADRLTHLLAQFDGIVNRASGDGDGEVA